ncbi:MAG: hypothetical protein AAF711_07275 [Planctomycetota bacterium]
MIDVILIVAICLLPIAWLVTEFLGPRSVRITLGILCMLILASAWFHSRQRTHFHNARNAAVIRMLGETLKKGDISTAQNAIDLYENEKRWHPSQPALEYLDKQQTDQAVEID